VTKVALLPDTQSRWGNPNLKVYSTEVVLRDDVGDAKPGVSARAEIVITNLKDVITVPIQSVATAGGQLVCYVEGTGGPKPVPVEIGLYNTKFIEVTKGLSDGDRVLLAPPVSTTEDLGGAVLANTEGLDLPSDRPQPSARPLAMAGRPEGEAGGSGDGARGGGEGAGAGASGDADGDRPGGGRRGDEPGQGDGERGDRAGGGGGFDPAARAAFLQQFDADGDGQLSDDERSAARAARGGGGGRPRGEGGNPGTGEG
jgi:hypothetical protein